MKLGTILMAGLLIVVGAHISPRAQDSEDKAHQQWVEARYKEAKSIRTGMTRADLLKLFWLNGGIQTTEQHYTLKSCPLIKIDVKFDKYDFSNKQADDSVRIVEVSRPYLEPMFLD